MPRLPGNTEIGLQHRFKATWSEMSDLTMYGKAVTLPTMQMSEATIARGNYVIPLKGRIKWEPITLTCYRIDGLLGPNTLKDLIAYYNKNIQNGINTDLGEDYRPMDLYGDLTINLLGTGITANPTQGTIKLKNAFVSSIALGQMDWGANGVHEITMTVKYDYCTISGASI